MQPQMVAQPGPGALQPGMLPEQIASYSSINSFNSQDSMGSARGSAMSKAFQKAQQQVQSGMLSEAQVTGRASPGVNSCCMPHSSAAAEAECMKWGDHTVPKRHALLRCR